MPTDPAISAKPGPVPGLKIPGHIGVIMDGNGRWAKARGKARTEGHVEGVKALRRLVELSITYGIKHLTVFSFSSENWSRPKDEINFIFGLLHRFVASDLARLIANNVRVRIIGSRTGLEDSLQRLIVDVEAKTAGNTGLNLLVAFNYGGKNEIVEAARLLAADVLAGRLQPHEINEARFAERLSTAGIPDPELIIRTSGEQRVSNFLLWQGAYSELVFVDQNWPDFDEASFVSVLEEFSARERRFGGVEAQPR
jgi:undecaprenyl diphosphate synthase